MNQLAESQSSPTKLPADFSPGPHWLPWAVGAFVLAAYLAAAATLAPGWDEGYTWKRLDALEPWLAAWASPRVSITEQLSRTTLDRHWQFSREEPDGHGPAYALLSWIGRAATHGFLPPPLSYRVGSVVLFGVAVWVLTRTLQTRWGAWPAVIAALLVASQPRLLPEVSFGIVDGPLLSLAILAFCGAVAFVDRPGLSRLWRIAVPAGLAMATKLTGWVWMGPLGLFVLLFGRRFDELWGVRRAMKPAGWRWVVLVGFFVVAFGDRRRLIWSALFAMFALAVCVAANVGWWPDPWAGMLGFFRSNLTRAETIKIGTWFLGSQYDFALPWYNTLVWTVVATPPLTLLLGALGLVACGRQKIAGFAAIGWLTIMVVRALPQAPGHDGVRQIALAFGLLAILGGWGTVVLARRFGKRIAMLFGATAVAWSAADCARYHPLELSYYSEIVGGLPGAASNFEPTYFWDALTPDVVRWLNDHTEHDRTVLFQTNPENWRYLQRWGTLTARPHTPETAAMHNPQWYVMQHRTGSLHPHDRRLLAYATPAFRKSLFGVPLVSVYDVRDYDAARAATSTESARRP